MLKTMLELARYNWQPDFIAYRERNVRVYGVVKLAVGLTMVLGFYGLDIILSLPGRTEILQVRLASAAVLAPILLSLIWIHDRKLVKSLMYFTYYVFVIYSAVLTATAGGYGSSYWAGFNFVLIFWFGLAPFGYVSMLINGLTFVALYNGLLYALAGTSYSSVRLVEFNVFLMGTLSLGVVISYFNNYGALKVFLANIELNTERDKSESLLLSILPREIAQRLKVEKGIIANKFQSVTVLFSDLVGFTNLSERLEPEALVNILNDIFSQFDELSEQHGLEKIKTIGDAYMVVGGAPQESADHVERIIAFAISILKAMREISARHGHKLSLRIGVHSGPVVAGVIGSRKFAYDLWGDTVNTASRMESHGSPGRIHVSEVVYEQLRDRYDWEDRGIHEIKGKGLMHTYFLAN